MNVLKEPRIESLRKTAGESGKLDYAVGTSYFQINLLNENINLWKQTLQQNKPTDNLLLACDKNTEDLLISKLTWVVGSAIRGTTVSDATEAKKLLTHMGVDNELAKAAVKHCPGLAEDLVWAFYLERHGWLTATPVARSEKQTTRTKNNK